MIVGDVIAYLVTLFDAAVSVPVVDGPVPSSVNHNDFVLVGSTGEEEDGATIVFDPSDLGPGGWRDETGEVVCSSWSWGGGTDIPARRASAAALALACIDAVQADRSLGGLLTGPGRADAGALAYQPRQTDHGAIVRFVFTVSYRNLST